MRHDGAHCCSRCGVTAAASKTIFIDAEGARRWRRRVAQAAASAAARCVRKLPLA